MMDELDRAMGKAIEGAGEFLAAMGKTMRLGWHSANPETQETNEEWVRRGMLDLRNALSDLDSLMPPYRKLGGRDADTARLRVVLSVIAADGLFDEKADQVSYWRSEVEYRKQLAREALSD